jgi:2,5-dioxopentanoate dehydrogenase
LDGSFFIGREAVASDQTFTAVDPAEGAALQPAFAVSTPAHVERACALAAEAFDSFRETDPDTRARFLEAVADGIEALGDELVLRAMQESGLPRPRLEGERGRTTGQLRLFATTLRQGRWAGVTLDTPLPDRKPLPRPDLRQRRIAVGPVAVFGASNFPLAFSTAGGDTASAWAAGCPVVVKGHPAHPGTSALVGKAIRDAVAACGLHEGVFSLLQGPSNELGAALVSNPHIRAVGFTGSRGGGLALMALAAARPEPIPVYAEMSSINPVVLFPAALAARGEALAKGYIGSLTLGSGQFCTNPGVVLALAGPELDRFVTAAAAALAEAPAQVMLTGGIHQAYNKGVDALSGHDAVELVGRGVEGSGCTRGVAALFTTDASSFLADRALGHEVFGAASILVRCRSTEEIAAVIESMEGQLTATLQIDPADEAEAAKLVPLLERKAGRILANGWPTGVEVSTAMVHGGPFPATSDSRTTSVGTAAIERFLRPVCYQDLPDALLPAALKAANPLGLPRTIDGTPERG